MDDFSVCGNPDVVAVDTQNHVGRVETGSVSGTSILYTINENGILARHLHSIAVLILLDDQLKNQWLRLVTAVGTASG